MKVGILAGGLGSRLSEKTGQIPKPLVEIGGRPILWHIMKHYAHYGFREFILALGYKGEVVKDYFLNYRNHHNDLIVNLKDGKVQIKDSTKEDWIVHLLDTGEDTQTGGRVRRMMRHAKGEPILLTYGDGVSNVDLKKLVAFHKKHGKAATVTATRPPARFGSLLFDGDRVKEFVEKPQIGEGWINGGYFVLEPRVLDYIDGDSSLFERTPLEKLAREGELMAYKHDGFWQCMDTLRDVRRLEELWQKKSPPWKVWKR